METINPRITIQNAEGAHWHVTLELELSPRERIAATVLITKADMPVSQLEAQARSRAIELLQKGLQRIGTAPAATPRGA